MAAIEELSPAASGPVSTRPLEDEIDDDEDEDVSFKLFGVMLSYFMLYLFIHDL